MVSLRLLPLLSALAAAAYRSRREDVYSCDYEEDSNRHHRFIDSTDAAVEYHCTMASHLLKDVFECIREMVEPKSCTISIMRFIKSTKTGFTPVKGAHIARLLGYAVSLVPVDIFDRYYEEYERRKYVECFSMLAGLFCAELRYERTVRRLLVRYNDDSGCSGSRCPTHFAFFDGEHPIIEPFAVARNIECCSKLTPSEYAYFYLPCEVMFIDEWLRFSLEFDCFLLDMLCCVCEKIEPLVSLYRHHFDGFNRHCISWDSAKRECYITNLKVFSYYIVAVCIPCYGSVHHFDKVCPYLLEMFRDNKVSISEHISIGFNILNKSN